MNVLVIQVAGTGSTQCDSQGRERGLDPICGKQVI